MSGPEQIIHIELVPLPDREHLEREWLELEARSDSRFFTSWSWIRCWLSCLTPSIQPRLLRATKGKVVVGLGLLVTRDFMRHRILPVKAFFLHATGGPLFDDITIEYNGFLIDGALPSTVIPLVYEHLAAMSDDWDEFHLDGIPAGAGANLPVIEGLRINRQQKSCRYVHLQEIRAGKGDYLARLGPNTRYKIRRSTK